MSSIDDYEVLRRNEAADSEIRVHGEAYELWVAGELALRTRVGASAMAEFEDVVATRTQGLRARLAKERANGAYRDMAGENASARASKGAGGKGGRGGV